MLPGALSASETMQFTVDRLVEHVLQGNRDLRAALWSLDAARSASAAAAALPNPRLDWSGGRAAARAGVGGSGSVQTWGAAQLIEHPDLRRARVDTALATERGSERSIAVVRNELSARVRLGAYEAVLRREEAAAADESVKLLEQVREKVRVRVESGEAARYEIIKADAEIVTARQRRGSAALLAEKALLDLNRLAGGRLPQGWQLVARLADEAPPPRLEDTLQQALANNPELAVLGAEVDRARALWRSAQASRWPGFELRVEHSRDPELSQNTVGVSVQVPLLDSRASVVAQAAAELARAEGLLEDRKKELRQQVLLAWKALEMASLNVEALSQGAIREAESALRVAEAAYRFGERGILEVLDAQRVLRSVRSDLLEARFQVQAARIALDQLAARYVGSSR